MSGTAVCLAVLVASAGFAGGETEVTTPEDFDVNNWTFEEQTSVTLLTGWVGGSEAEAEMAFVEGIEERFDNLDIELERMPSDRIRQVSNSRIAAGNPPAIAHGSRLQYRRPCPTGRVGRSHALLGRVQLHRGSTGGSAVGAAN